MIEISRRNVLAGAAAATAVSAVGSALVGAPAHAKAPLAGKQAAGWYRYKVGTFEVTAVTDGARTFPLPDTFVKNANKDAINSALAAGYMERDKITAPFTPVVVNTGSHLVAFDTGNGAGQYEQSKGAVGQYHTNLVSAGIDAKTVDMVVISHFHGDHINGLITLDNKPAFANAEIMVPAAEWKYWSDDGNMSKAAGSPLEANFKNIRRVFGALGNKVSQYEPGKELVSGITSVATPGHTPGHCSHVVASGNAQVLVQADVTAALAVLFVRNPGWHAVFDMDGPLAEATRRKTYDMAAADRMLIQGFHFPFPSVGYIEKDGANFRLVPKAWNPSL